MSWFLIENKETNESQIVASLNGINTNLWKASSIGSKPLEEFEEIDKNGNIVFNQEKKNKKLEELSFNSESALTRHNKSIKNAVNTLIDLLFEENVITASQVTSMKTKLLNKKEFKS